MNLETQPLVVLFGFEKGQEIVFTGRCAEFTLDLGVYSEEMLSFLSKCNGTRTLNEIKKELGIKEEVFFDIVDAAEQMEIIIDSRKLYLRFHEDSIYPPTFYHELSLRDLEGLMHESPPLRGENIGIGLAPSDDYFVNLCLGRKSIRSFTGDALSFVELSDMLQAAYTLHGGRSVPSAGTLNPLTLYVAVMSDILIGGELPKGLYQLDPFARRLYSMSNAVISKDTIGRLLDSNIAENASVVFFVVAKLNRSTAKYANRGYRFALLEAGHMAQNLYMYAAGHRNIGVVEVGGFHDQACAKYLGLNYPEEVMLTGIVAGRAKKGPQDYVDPSMLLYELKAQLVGPSKPIEWVYLNQNRDGIHYPLKARALSKYRVGPDVPAVIKSKDRVASGTSICGAEAVVKAIAEGYERYCSGLLRVDEVSSASRLGADWLDPRVITPLRTEAYQRFGLQEFDPDFEWQWVRGSRIGDQSSVLVPIEHVFYPITTKQIGRKPCYVASSSGVAAGWSYEEAINRALFELVERDAIAVTWYSKKGVTAIPRTNQPEDVRLRIDHWASKGFQTKVLNLTLESVPVILVMIYSNTKHPALASGASAAPHDIGFAISKAWDEAEYFMTGWRNRRSKKVLAESYVQTPLDHGILYFKPENLGNVKWLLEAPEEQPKSVSSPNVPELLKRYNPVFVDLTPKKTDCRLKIVRLISENLLPINFGYGTEHITHRRISDLGLEWVRRYPAFPHFFP